MKNEDLVSRARDQLANSDADGEHSTEGDERHKIIAITGTTKLLAAQKQVDSEMHHRQRQAFNAGVVIFDARLSDMPVAYGISMFEKVTGYSSGEAVGHSCRFLQGSEVNQSGVSAVCTAIPSSQAATPYGATTEWMKRFLSTRFSSRQSMMILTRCCILPVSSTLSRPARYQVRTDGKLPLHSH